MNINKQRFLAAFILGLITMLLLGLVFRALLSTKEPEISNDHYIITNQIRKMNKMVVMEQDFSTMQRTKMSTEILGGGLLPAMDKEIMTFTKTNAQVSYDLNKMRLDVDSVNRQLIIEELPSPELKITPSVEISSLNDSFFNRFDESDIQKIQKSAKDAAVKRVNREQLLSDGRRQLMQNLDQIFVLAKALDYKIVDKTGKIDTTKL
ncbi:DUF4230 domain-containing protein [Planobacterium oryzisoli]|uniref:DUF4230 domain-containing protein n=1 Tax=Planobacterium oryzisoli TaxID=2771435 RepID=A0A931E473_9FLAO|nr:DUF4230 domain-containing protein [Planobacterium oryzisoli]MBF5026300.1 DUF4230 domain-containing protein [Planobacterium oryzisoli]